MANKKYYVVWAGHDTGVFDTWEDCKLQVEGFPGARYKSFDSRLGAIGPISVYAACSRNPGPVEYQGVDISTGRRLFHVGPMAGGSNNMGEFLAIIHALALLEKQGRPDVTIYTDSRTAMSWVRNRKVKTTIAPTPQNAYIRSLVARAEAWLQTHTPQNRILKWDTEHWGEIPADFGRK